MSEFSMLDEIEKYLLEIFENKVKSIENKQRFYERILKKIEQLVKFQIMFPPVSHLCFHFFKQVSRV